MRRIPVRSSNVKSIGYDADESTLEVAFLDGSVYQYYDVSQSVWSEFRVAPSKGKFIWTDLKDQYEYERIV